MTAQRVIDLIEEKRSLWRTWGDGHALYTSCDCCYEMAECRGKKRHPMYCLACFDPARFLRNGEPIKRARKGRVVSTDRTSRDVGYPAPTMTNGNTQAVVIYGPNLSSAAQRKGDLHVHAAGCADGKHYGPGRKFGGDYERETFEAESRWDVSARVYADHLSDDGLTLEDAEGQARIAEYVTDFYFAPCVTLPKSDAKPTKIANRSDERSTRRRNGTMAERIPLSKPAEKKLVAVAAAFEDESENVAKHAVRYGRKLLRLKAGTISSPPSIKWELPELDAETLASIDTRVREIVGVKPEAKKPKAAKKAPKPKTPKVEPGASDEHDAAVKSGN